MAKAIPDGYHSVTPYLIIKGASAAIEFYKQAFNAVELCRMDGPDGRIGHAPVMLADEHPAMNALAPSSIGGSPVGLMIYTDDCDAMYHRAVEAGAAVVRPIMDQFYGDRNGQLDDPYGHRWTIA